MSTPFKKVPDMPNIPLPPPQEKPSIPKQSSDTVRREIDRIARQQEGLSKALKRVRDSLK